MILASCVWSIPSILHIFLALAMAWHGCNKIEFVHEIWVFARRFNLVGEQVQFLELGCAWGREALLGDALLITARQYTITCIQYDK